MKLRVAEQYVESFGQLAKEANTLVIPANLADIASMISLATNIASGTKASAKHTEVNPS
jgi:hypothetical protein